MDMRMFFPVILTVAGLFFLFVIGIVSYAVRKKNERLAAQARAVVRNQKGKEGCLWEE